jgi:NAD+ synthase (glutamine-hydrolysing)
MDFHSAYHQGFVRVAACTLHTAIADPAANAESVLRVAGACHDEHVGVAVYPELSLSGYSLEDIVMQDTLLDSVESALDQVIAGSANLLPVLVVGAPLRFRHRIYNTAVVIHRGQVLGVVPKSYLPTYREFYERRQIAPGDDERGVIRIGDQDVPFGPDLLFAATDIPGFVVHVEICEDMFVLVVHVEICEDMFVPVPPSAEAALAGATVLANLSGSPITIGRAEDRCLLARSASARCLAAYVYAAAGEGESTTDLAWDGQTMVWENGVCLAQSERFPKGERRSVADVDLDLLRSERLRMGTFDDNRRHHLVDDTSFRRIEFALDPPAGDIGLRRKIERFPFVPSDTARLEQDCYEAYNIQVSGLEQRLRALDYPKVILGLSGGLDSTHALIVAARAMDREQRPRSDIMAFTLPGFATGERTKKNAGRLAEALGVTFAEIDITETAKLMLAEMDHPFARGEKVYDVTFENVQAGLRTDYLFRLANQRGGIVLGTGDLSELALGWSTYGVGDQMSHYNVNGGVPKTLIQHLIRWVISSTQFDESVNDVLASVLDTEISPELIPTGEDEEIQSSEGKVGPYVLQDFSLFHVLRFGFRPSKIAFLAWHAWRDAEQGDWPTGYPMDKRPSYSMEEIRHWLQVFAQRFYSFSQFKRSALPNGPKVSHGGSLSPRGDWRAPSDMSARIWLDEIERTIPQT